MGHTAGSSWRAVAQGFVSLTLAWALTACGGLGGPGPAGTTTSPVTTSPTTSPVTTSPTTSPVTTSATPGAPPSTATATTLASGKMSSLPVYWIGESRRSFALYREFRAVPATGGPISSAVSAMTRLRPLDPDYLTPWRPASRVTASQTGDAITVDLSTDAFAGTQVGSELAELAVQQLVYTATAAAQQAGAPASSVKITVDGAAFDAWGVVRLGEPMQRAPLLKVQAHTWVTSPEEGEELRAGTVRFKGFGSSFESNFRWQVRNASGAVVAKSFTTAVTGNAAFGEFTFTVQLNPGKYSVEVSDDDASGGAEGPGAAVDDKSFTVR